VELLKEQGAEAIVAMSPIRFAAETGKLRAASSNSGSNNKEILIDLGGAAVERDKDLKDSIIYVEEGASLRIKNTVIDGKSIIARRALIGVYGELYLDDGAKLVNGKNSMSKPEIACGGAVYSANGTVSITGSAEISNNEAAVGGGIYMHGGTLNMDGGVIKNNSAKAYDSDDFEKSNGGGVALNNNALMNMSSGTISENIADSDGGGISVGGRVLYYENYLKTKELSGTLNMTGGTISNNTAKSAGGGIFVQCNTVANISGGIINNNAALDKYRTALHAGGGIYVNGYHNDVNDIPNGILYIKDVEIADNTSDGEGAAIAWCGSGSGSVNMTDGSVIHDNNGEGLITNVRVKEGEDVFQYNHQGVDVLIDELGWKFNEKGEIINLIDDGNNGDYHEGEYIGVVLYETTTEIIHWTVSASISRENAVAVSGTMLNGAAYNWTDENGDSVSEEDMKSRNKTFRLSTKATATDADVKESLESATVHITGNYSATNGGGIASNGDVYIGKTPEEVQGEYEPPGENPEESVKGVSEEESGKVKGAYKSKSANTGDDSDIIFLLLVTLFAAAAFSTMAIRRRRG